MFNAIELEGLAVTRLNGYRTRRPKQRPKKSKGHGFKPKWRDRLKDKVPVRPVAVPMPKIPDFLIKMLARRPEARRLLTAEMYNETLASISPKVRIQTYVC